MYINLDSYRVFYFVAQYRSFTKAAELLYSNQPNVTRTIKHLEQALGCSLFVRSSRKVQLTPEGEKLFAHIAPAMEQIRAGEDSVLLESSLKGGSISIGASEIALDHVLLPVLKEFRRLYPQVRLQIYNSTTPQALSALRDRTVDLALVTTPLESFDSLNCQTLLTFRDVPVCAQTQDATTLAVLASHSLVCLRKGTATYELYRGFFHSHGLTFSPDIEAATSSQIIPLVRAGLGIGFVPEHTALEASADGSVHILRLEEALPQRSICLLKRKESPLSTAARELERMILDYSNEK